MNAIYYNESSGRGASRVIILGSVYILLGGVALYFASATTLTTVIALAVALLIAGGAEIFYGIQGRRHGQLWPHLTFGCLALICGGLILFNPLENTLGLTLIAGFLLIASGLVKLIGSVIERSRAWGWYATNGIVSVLLGALILREFPASAIWTIGVFVAIDLIVAGATLIGLGVSAKRTRREHVGEIYSTLNPEPGSREAGRHEHPLH